MARPGPKTPWRQATDCRPVCTGCALQAIDWARVCVQVCVWLYCQPARAPDYRRSTGTSHFILLFLSPRQHLRSPPASPVLNSSSSPPPPLHLHLPPLFPPFFFLCINWGRVYIFIFLHLANPYQQSPQEKKRSSIFASLCALIKRDPSEWCIYMYTHTQIHTVPTVHPCSDKDSQSQLGEARGVVINNTGPGISSTALKNHTEQQSIKILDEWKQSRCFLPLWNSNNVGLTC